MMTVLPDVIFAKRILHPALYRWGEMKCKIIQFVSCLKYTSKCYWVNFIAIGADNK